MGFLQLVPADSLTATYKTKTHKLSLNAKGNALTFTSSVSFQRMPWEGGLLFDLQGWVGPRAIGTTPYDITDYFDIELPNVVTPSNTIIVKTADGNKTIDIVYEPPLPRGAASNGGSNGASDKTVQVPETKDGGATDRTVLYKMPFDITETVGVLPLDGSITVSFDKTFLTLTAASVKRPVSEGSKTGQEIIWTFESLQTGDTQIVVNISGGIAPYIVSKLYNLKIEVLEAGTANGNNKTKIEATAGVPLSWLGFVNIGVNLIEKSYQNVVLLEADATPIDHAPVNSPWGLNSLQVVCRVGDNKTAIIRSTGWGEFGPIEYIEKPWLEDVDIAWPLSPELGMQEAWDILMASGYNGLVSGCTLRQPLYPGSDQVYYIFSCGNRFIAVGVKDKKTHEFSSQGKVLA